MISSLELTRLFFRELKSYNSTNFRTIQHADLSKQNATVHKAFSSVVTRYFIFAERHPEISDSDRRILYEELYDSLNYVKENVSVPNYTLCFVTTGLIDHGTSVVDFNEASDSYITLQPYS